MKIAITGTIGGGKSSVSRRLIELGYPVYDTDKLVHTYYEKNGRLEHVVIEMFGKDILNKEGRIDRGLLANKVFEDFDALRRLESVVYPVVSEHIDELYHNYKGIMFFEVPMLFESHLEHKFDRIMMVTARKDIRMERLEQRGMSQEDVERRSLRHLDEQEKIKRSDIIINNDGDLNELNVKIDLILKELKGR